MAFRSALLVIVVILAMIGCKAPGRAQSSPRQCLLLDADGAFDDLRALAWLLGVSRVDAMVLTSGVARPSFAQNAVERFMRSAKVSETRRPDIFVGKESPREFSAYWSKVRERDERLNSWLAQSERAKVSRSIESREFLQHMQACDRIDVVLLGPLSSAVFYFPIIQDRLGRVVTMGRRDERDFNCWFDEKSCARFFESYGALVSAVYVPERPTKRGQYKFETGDLKRFGSSEMSSVLAAIFAANLEGWQPENMRMWDDVAAMFFLHTELFERSGSFWIPKAEPQTFKSLWFSAFE